VKILTDDWDIAASSTRFIEKMQRRARSDALNDELNAAKKAKDWNKAISLCDDLLTLDPVDNVDIAAEKFRILLVELKDYSRAYAFGRQAVTTLAHNDARTLNRIAFPIVDPKLKIENQDLDLALDAAKRANELKKAEGPYVLNTLARIHFVKGEAKEAIIVQKTALSFADPESKAEFQSTLEEYENASR
jgi:tetratricopeptide (TPR) repeat protein